MAPRSSSSSEIGSASFGLVVGLDKFGQDLDKGEAKAKESGKKIGEGLTSEAEKSVKSGGEGVSTAVAGLAATAAAVFGAGLAEAIDRQGQNAKLAASLGLSPDEAKRAGKVAGQIFADNYGESIEQVNEALSNVMGSSAQFRNASDADLKTLTEAAINYANTFDTDVTTAMRNVSVLMDTGLADTGQHAFDLMIAAAQAVPPAMRDELQEATQEYSQFAKGLGLTGDQMLGMFAKVSDGGTYMIDKVGDSLKEFRIRVTDGSKSTSTALETLGFNAHDMANAVLAGGAQANQAFQEIVSAIMGIQDPAQKAQVALALFGTPLEDISGDGAKMNEVLGAMWQSTLPNVQGATERLDTALNDNFASRLETTKRSIENWVISLADSAIPVLDQLPGPIGNVVMGLLAMGSEVVPVIKEFGVFLLLLQGGGGVGGAGGLIGALTTMGPYALAAIAALAATYIIVQNWDSIAKFFDSFGEHIVDIFQGFADWLGDHWVDVVTTALAGPFVEGAKLIIQNWDTVKAWFGDFVSYIGRIAKGMWQPIEDAFKGVINFIIRAWNSLHFDIPAVDIPLVGRFGGQRIGLPQLPYLDTGGRVDQSGLAVIHQGEMVVPRAIAAQVSPLDRIGGDTSYRDTPATPLVITLDGRQIARALIPHYADRQRITGRPAFGR